MAQDPPPGQGIRGPRQCACTASRYTPLMEWVNLAGQEVKPEKLRKNALLFLDFAKQAAIRIDDSTVRVCPHGNFDVVSQNTPCTSHDPEALIQVWANNVPLVYEMLDRFNAYTSHLKSLSTPDDELYYDGPLRLFNKMDFECLKNASSVMELFYKKDKAVRDVVLEIRLS